MALRKLIDRPFKVPWQCASVFVPAADGCGLGISVAAYNVGCFFGAISTIFIGDRLGRRKTIFLGSSIMVVGATLQCSSFSLAQFITGRLVTGYEL